MMTMIFTAVSAQTDQGLIWAAIIGAIGVVVAGVLLIVVKRVKPAVGVTDMWKQINTQNEEIRNQNKTIGELQSAVNTLQEQAVTTLREQAIFRDTQFRINQNLGDGFDALYGYVLRTTTSGTEPSFTPEESSRINKARATRADQKNQPEVHI